MIGSRAIHAAAQAPPTAASTTAVTSKGWERRRRPGGGAGGPPPSPEAPPPPVWRGRGSGSCLVHAPSGAASLAWSNAPSAAGSTHGRLRASTRVTHPRPSSPVGPPWGSAGTSGRRSPVWAHVEGLVRVQCQPSSICRERAEGKGTSQGQGVEGGGALTARVKLALMPPSSMSGAGDGEKVR